MNRKYNKEKKEQKNIAHHRIHYLFTLAENYARKGKLTLSDRYVDLARRISMKYLVPIPKEYSRRFCKHCYCYLRPPLNCRIRINNASIITYCDKCKRYSRIPLHQRSLSVRNS